MNTIPNLTILDNQIRQIDNLYCLNDLHKASGANKKHQPANFARLETTKQIVTEIESETPHSSDVRSALKVINGGKNRGTFVCKELVYSYAMWISAKFSLVVIRAFDNLVSSPNQEERLNNDQIGFIYQTVMQVCANTGQPYQKIFGGLKRQFGVNSYKSIKPTDFAAACSWLNVVPPKHLIDNRPTTVTLSATDRENLARLPTIEGWRRAGGWSVSKMVDEMRALEDLIDKVKCQMKVVGSYRASVYDSLVECPKAVVEDQDLVDEIAKKRHADIERLRIPRLL